MTFVLGEPPWIGNLYLFMYVIILNLPLRVIPAVVQFIKAEFFIPLSTNSLFWAHWASIHLIFGFGPQIETPQLAPSMGRACALVSAIVKHGGIKSTPGRSTSNRACKFSTVGQFSQP